MAQVECTHLLSPKHNGHGRPFSGPGMQGSQGSLWGILKGFIVTTTGHTLKKKLPLPFRVKVKLYTKTKSKNITVPA